MDIFRSHVLICGGEDCRHGGSDKIMEHLNRKLREFDLEREIKPIHTGCFGLCEVGPIVIVYPEGTFYSHVGLEDVDEIVREHLLKGRIVRRLLHREKDQPEGDDLSLNHVPFYQHQTRVALRNCGIIDPENIDEYLAYDGYKALEKALQTMQPEEVIEQVIQSGLRGRGGGGFPTGIKWRFARQSAQKTKYVICNADEGDPHAVIEAMAITGYAIGSNEGYIYVRAEYPIAVKRLQIAIDQAKEYGLLGKNILGSGFDFDIHIRLGAGAFVCGEETALMVSIEGERGEPHPKPPFPAVKGLFGMPSNINNVETYANIPQILIKGADWFRSMGTSKSPGTKVFALGGKINNTGLVEVPMGTPLRTVIYDIGGGIPNGRQFKAVQTGGPSGGCIPSGLLDVPIEYDSLIEIGSMMGSGGMIVMDEDNCMVDIARFFLDFTVDESCGKCTPCRIGTKRMLEILNRIVEGKGKEGDIEALEKLARNIKATALCGLGQTAPNPVLSTLHYFREEYEAHIKDHKCPAHHCTALLEYTIGEKCRGCTACVRACPVGAITGEVKGMHTIHQDKCIKCGACMSTCRFDAISRH